MCILYYSVISHEGPHLTFLLVSKQVNESLIYDDELLKGEGMLTDTTNLSMAP